MAQELNFLSYLTEVRDKPLSTEEIISCIVPFLEKLQDLHEVGKVSPLKDIYEVKVFGEELTFDESHAEDAASDNSRFEELLSKPGSEDLIDFIEGYTCWEFENFGHYDALTDIYIAGLILASLSLNINFRDKASFDKFKENHKALHKVFPSLHPVLNECIKRMTALQRAEREADLESIIYLLNHYEEQVINENDFELENKEKTPQELLGILQNRLYDFTKRNRLIYFKETRQALNLTNGSIPLNLLESDFDRDRSIIWNDKLKSSISGLKNYNLSDYLELDTFPWVTKSLTAIRATANKNLREYGFSQLRLCIAFLKWHNLKEKKEDKILSPLLLVPVTLKKKRGIRDSWVITFQSQEAVINPCLKEYLNQLYGLELPEFVDIEKESIDSFYEQLKTEISRSEPSVQLDFTDSPDLKAVERSNKKKLERYEKRTGKSIEVPKPETTKESPEPNQAPEPEPVKAEAKKENLSHFYWEMDVASTVLGNFNYRKMTLVRDYKSILNENLLAENFLKIFTDRPKEQLPEPDEIQSFEEVFHILPADPSQMAAVEHAREGKSYIIQGPPGTGKSQTISNLIADYTARDKRVLFVCEKRAALDVVYHRLGQSGLKKLCCMIHDSQDDKKAFIHDLKDCYETLSQEEDTSVSKSRKEVVIELDKVLKEISRFYQTLNSKVTNNSSINSMISRAVEIYNGHELDIPEMDIPEPDIFENNALAIESVYTTVREQLNEETFFETPFSILNAGILKQSDPERKLNELLQSSLPILKDSLKAIINFTDSQSLELQELLEFLKMSKKITGLYEKSLIFLIDKKSPEASKAYKSIATLRGLKTKAKNRAAKNENWKEKLSPDETERALAIAANTENSFIRFFLPSWWKLRKIINRDYDFSAHKLPPAWSEILNDLHEEHRAVERVKEAEEKLLEDYNFTDVEFDLSDIDDVRKVFEEFSIDCNADAFENNRQHWEELASQFEKWQLLSDDFSDIISLEGNCEEAIDKLIRLQSYSDRYHLAHPILEELFKLPQSISDLIRKYPLNHVEFEYEILAKEINNFINSRPDFKKFDFKKIESLRNKFYRLLKKLHKINARWVLEKKSGTFSEHLKICNSPAAELTSEQKEFKKSYNRGRKELEHEFGKKMRYKSIRDLAAGESGQVVKDLKPIWLMSPLSVSDTIPLDEIEFDAVIFDEASQIVVEESIPTLYRSKQFIIVGDEKQLPPTSFFNVRSETAEELNVLNADSLLSVSAMTVPATLLRWHYRSKNEWLISFSNSAFYKRRLLTIPEKSHQSRTKQSINVESCRDAENNYKYLTERPISFHFLKNGVYEQRRNKDEAEYISILVRKYLTEEENLTLGIVAFSEAQQEEIESCLDKLAESDEKFAEKYRQAQERTEDGHYEGLFVKNLENVQGDERDIMILSICYGKNAEGKMRMNFGPINHKGGQKRLNVIVTRARRHVAVVSSIKGDWITNDYNEGALCFKRYLKYAEAVSNGEIENAEWLLNSMSLVKNHESASNNIYSNFAGSINHNLKKENIGTSEFKIPLGLGNSRDGSYELALFDVSGQHKNACLDMAFMRPELLKNFGWDVSAVTSKDVYLNPERVLREIDEKIAD